MVTINIFFTFQSLYFAWCKMRQIAPLGLVTICKVDPMVLLDLVCHHVKYRL